MVPVTGMAANPRSNDHVTIVIAMLEWPWFQ